MHFCRTGGIVVIGVAASAALAGNDIVTGYGATPHVKAFDLSGTNTSSFFAYTPSFSGGVRVASGDVNGDGMADIVTGAGPGGGPHVKVFDGKTGAEIRSFFAYDAGFAGGVFVAAGDVDGDGHADIVTGTGEGVSSHVKVFDGATGAEAGSFFAFDPSFLGGVRVATGDVNGDGRAEIVVGAGASGQPEIKVFDQSFALTASFLAYDSGFRGGVFVAAGDMDGDGRADIVSAPDAGMAPHVKVFRGADFSEYSTFLAYDRGYEGGVRIGARDGLIVTGTGPGAGPQFKAFSGPAFAERLSMFAYDAGALDGIYVAAAPVPEPASLTALAVGICLLRRRRRL